MSTETFTIDDIGADGDGVAASKDGAVFIPFGLPGETVAVARVKNQGTILSISQPSPDRVTAPCKHFGPDAPGGTCGSCSLQHWRAEPYQAWKRNRVVGALARSGIDVETAPLVPCLPGTRRRLVLSGRATEKGVVLGFASPASHHIVGIEECLVATPAIVNRLPAIRRMAESLAGGSDAFRLTVLDTLTGLDLAFENVRKLDDASRRRATEATLKEKGIARLSVNGEIVVEPVRPQLDFFGVTVCPPPAGFTQATVAAEQAMAELVMAGLGKAKKVADLFAGCGTFSLRIARKHAVHAVEFDAPALAALEQAASRAQGLKPVTTERRDLFRRPMMPMDLKGIDAVVFDPPRAGAEAQASELSRSKVARIVAVSCNPLTLARDLKILVDGGYRVTSVTPIDQFLHTAHVEAVAVLERAVK